MKKKTATQVYIDKAIEAAKEELAGNHISNCNVTMTVETGEAISDIASALEVNAQALGELARAIKNQPISAFHITSESVDTA